MIPRLFPLATFFAIAVMLGIGLVWKSSEPSISDRASGSPLPPFQLRTLDGSLFSERELREKVAAVNFFAHWCAPCLAEHGALKTLGKKLPVYGIAWKDNPEKLAAWLATHGTPYRQVALDPEGAAAIGFGISGVPETFILGVDGAILYHHTGPLTEERLQTEIFPLIERMENAP